MTTGSAVLNISDAVNESLRLVGERREEGILTPTSYSSGKPNLKTQKIQKYLHFLNSTPVKNPPNACSELMFGFDKMFCIYIFRESTV